MFRTERDPDKGPRWEEGSAGIMAAPVLLSILKSGVATVAFEDARSKRPHTTDNVDAMTHGQPKYSSRE